MLSAQKAYAMLGNENLWQVATRCDYALTEAQLPYSVCGGVAVCLHGYQRNTLDLDLIIRRTDAHRVREALEKAGLVWDAARTEFQAPGGVPVQRLYAGERAGRDGEILLPEPLGDSNVETIESLTVLRLSRLIEVKIACALGNPRRTHKDLADVVELIAIRKLDGTFCRFLHRSLRETFRQLVRNAHGQD